jgi:glycosyltransferase involved in cell wall biosynthesis
LEKKLKTAIALKSLSRKVESKNRGVQMKVVMINDAAFVGETLLKYLPSGMEKQHVKRSRGLWDKSFGIALKILRAKGDIYHAHYLLQDCYIASQLGKKPLVGHAHGSDLRDEIKKRKWGWIIKHNLRKCTKILVAQPTILDTALKFNETAEYFPIPFDPQVFFPKPLQPERKEKSVFIASTHNFRIKGTGKFLKALASLSTPLKIKSLAGGKNFADAQQLARELSLHVDFIPKVPHDKMNELYWESDLVLGSFSIGQLDTVAIEAMACGRPVVQSISRGFFKNCPLEELENVEQSAEIIQRLLVDKKEREKRVESQLDYVTSTHSAPLLAERLLKLYNELYTNYES